MALQDHFEELQRHAHRTPCPTCEQQHLDLVLRCDLDYGRCLYTARCRSCRTSYLLALGPEIRRLDEGLPVAPVCPACGGQRRFERLDCDAGLRRCTWHMVCPDCQGTSAA